MDTHIQVIKILITNIPDEVDWAITGSTAFALQGIPVKPNDIDLQSDRSGIYQIEDRLKEYVVNPVQYSKTDSIASHFGSLEIQGIEVELMGDIQHKKSDGSWTEINDWSSLIKMINIEDLQIPVLKLEHEYEAYLMMGRHDRAALLKQYI